MLEALQRTLADALRGRVGRNQLRTLRLESAQLIHQPVVLLVRDYGFGFGVIEPVVLTDFGAQRLDAIRGRFGTIRAHHRPA